METTSGYTEQLVDQARRVDIASVPPSSIQRAKHCLLDWLAVTIAAAREPGVAMLREVVGIDAPGAATLVGVGGRTNPLGAALINGMAGHYLDYDDVGGYMNGHPTAPSAPALLALAERDRMSGNRVLVALIVAHDIAARLGLSIAKAHNDMGFHATGTFGTFAAAAGCAHLLELNSAQWASALGLAGTQAAGLRASFGTMAKPFHAGKAASGGLLAVELARRGFTASTTLLEHDQGFATSMASGVETPPAETFPAGPHAIDGVVFKYYSACYATHSAIAGARQLRQQHGFDPDDVLSATVGLMPEMWQVANIESPTTALEAKFSIGHVTAVALAGGDLSEQGFTDDKLANSTVIALRRRITVEPGPARLPTGLPPSPLKVTLRDGRELSTAVDISIPTPVDGLDEEWTSLVEKCIGLTTPALGRARAQTLVEHVAQLDQAETTAALMACASGAP